MVVVNMEGVKAGFEILPEATVQSRLASVKWKQGKKNPQYQNANCEFIIDEEAGEPWGGRKAFITLPTNPEGLGITKGALINMGVEPSELDGHVDLNDVFENLIGSSVAIRITVDKYNGEDVNRYKVISQDSWT